MNSEPDILVSINACPEALATVPRLAWTFLVGHTTCQMTGDAKWAVMPLLS